MHLHFNKKYRLLIDSISEDNDDVMCAAITISLEANGFIYMFKYLTNTGWIYYYTKNNQTMLLSLLLHLKV